MDNVIWLIDDDASVRESLVFLLSGMNWRVEPYESIAAFMAAHGAEQTLTGCLLLDIDACRRAFHNGVFEFFTKPLDADKLIESITVALAESQQRVVRWQEAKRVRALFEQLTAREHEVLLALMEGSSNKEVAARLNLSPRTVEAHRAAVFVKLGVSSLVQAIREYDKLPSVELPG